MKKNRAAVAVLILFLALLVSLFGWWKRDMEDRPEIFLPTTEETGFLLEPTQSFTAVLPETVSWPTPTLSPAVTSTPTPVSQVQGYVLAEKVDLASGKPVSLSIDLGEKGWLMSNWASAVAYTDGDSDVFAPWRGTIYSYLDDELPVTWAHSGVSLDGQEYFATNLERYLRKGGGGTTLTLEEAQLQADAWKGLMVRFCQETEGEIVPLEKYDPAEGCTGSEIWLRVTAVIVIPHDLVSEYDSVTVGIWDWLSEKYPEAGLTEMATENVWLLRFCLARLADQPEDGPWHLHNRAVIVWEVLK